MHGLRTPPAQEVLVLLSFSSQDCPNVSCAHVGGTSSFLHGTRLGAETPQDMERYIELHLRVSPHHEINSPGVPRADWRREPAYALCSSEASSYTRARNSRGLTPFTALNCREK